jgi:hypothetical protein
MDSAACALHIRKANAIREDSMPSCLLLSMMRCTFVSRLRIARTRMPGFVHLRVHLCDFVSEEGGQRSMSRS